MAKMFYSMDEVQQKLSRPREDIEQMVNDGLLRKFLDGNKEMFKVSDVDTLAEAGLSGTDISGSGEILLSPDDSTTGDTPLTPADTAEELGLAPDSADQISLDDTGAAKEASDDTVVTTHGVNILDDTDEDLELVDPLAQTQIADLESLDDHVSLDSSSSGSGLLDLSREADDTSLGAELLEEIYPGSDEGAVETQVPGGFELPSQTESMTGTVDNLQPQTLASYKPIMQINDPTSGVFGAMMLVPFVLLVLLAFVTGAAISGVQPKIVDTISSKIWFIVGGAAALAILIAVIGNSMAGKTATPKAKAAPKPKKEKKVKEKKKKSKNKVVKEE